MHLIAEFQLYNLMIFRVIKENLELYKISRSKYNLNIKSLNKRISAQVENYENDEVK